MEMEREKKNDRTIHCKYDPREPGDYQVEVDHAFNLVVNENDRIQWNSFS